MKLFSNTIYSLENALNYSSIKQKVIANNIANVDTPNYKAQEVSFKSELDQALLKAHRLDERHFEFKQNRQRINVYTKNTTTFNHNGNNVDIDKEMVEMAENQIYYNVLIEQLSGKFTALKEVLKGGNT
ncbi:flagellar basal body rod protein FlgB [Calidifontibacillus erzurumensis]|uniref:Flagellar basal body rod protein FlgB n=1 Tax=Calidifontibacillus erzurumensis TaxID=2741433 RepID=A0A8J8KDX8_9BACI|nr:flagellar basal body rod protein FlgB [Calidifontibacillus erzurumensis]NSL51190.1 flagellar basal body rod protein FlgB [Calidifontibacillus erzurumensis]